MKGEQATLMEATGGGCDHEDTVELPVPSPAITPDGHPWAGKHPVWCHDCRDVVDRV